MKSGLNTFEDITNNIYRIIDNNQDYVVDTFENNTVWLCIPTIDLNSGLLLYKKPIKVGIDFYMDTHKTKMANTPIGYYMLNILNDDESIAEFDNIRICSSVIISSLNGKDRVVTNTHFDKIKEIFPTFGLFKSEEEALKAMDEFEHDKEFVEEYTAILKGQINELTNELNRIQGNVSTNKKSFIEKLKELFK